MRCYAPSENSEGLNLDVAPYPFGFLLGSGLAVPPHFQRVRNDLHVHPKTSVHIAVTGNVEVILIGTCVDLLNPDRSQDEIAARLVRALDASEDLFHRYGDQLCGRYALIYQRGALRKAVSDATGLRAIFFSTCGRFLGSHAFLVAQQLGASKPVRQPFKMGFPGRGTPYGGVLLLTANTSVELGSAAVARIFPRDAIIPSAIDEVAEVVAYFASVAISALKRRGAELVYSVTAGLDSRTTIAASRSKLDGARAFTYGNVEDERRYRPSLVADEVLGPQIAEAVGMKHCLLVRHLPPPEVATVLRINSYHSAGGDTIVPLVEKYGQHSVIHIRSNILEIGRAYFRKYGFDLSVPEGNVGIYGLLNTLDEGQKEFVVRSFEEMYCVTDILSAFRMGYAPFDVVYWEHRMSAWHAQLVLNDDIAFDTFIPWNSRMVLAMMLRPEVDLRASGAVASIIIERAGLNKWPMNPKMGRKVKQEVKKISGNFLS